MAAPTSTTANTASPRGPGTDQYGTANRAGGAPAGRAPSTQEAMAPATNATAVATAGTAVADASASEQPKMALRRSTPRIGAGDARTPARTRHASGPRSRVRRTNPDRGEHRARSSNWLSSTEGTAAATRNGVSGQMAARISLRPGMPTLPGTRRLDATWQPTKAATRPSPQTRPTRTAVRTCPLTACHTDRAHRWRPGWRKREQCEGAGSGRSTRPVVARRGGRRAG